ncbi:NAD(P)H-quinone oxidoreductase subunit M chloroplastic [Bienertia sinuspersici]
MLAEMGFPKGLLPMKNVVECGIVRETGFVWMKRSAPTLHYFEGCKTLASYDTEVTCYIDKAKVTKITGVMCKHLFMWVTITDTTIDTPFPTRVHFKSSVLGIGKSFPITDFMTQEEKLNYVQHQG